jgi:putative N-acetyltransferase (TIGR04045 family)
MLRAFQLRAEGNGLIFEPVPPFFASEYRVKFATNRFELQGAESLRHHVFCEEQKIFHGHDRDEIDSRAIPIVALTSLGIITDEVVGTVRIHEAETGVWWGSRLAVAERYRKIGALGSALIRLAVSSAHARGCRAFFANVQSQNVPLFERMHWRSLSETELHGVPHNHMQADLDFYPPLEDAATGFLARPRKVMA